MSFDAFQARLESFNHESRLALPASRGDLLCDRPLAGPCGQDRWDLRAERAHRVRTLLVDGVYPNSPAQRSGVLPGDVVLKLNGQPLSSSGELFQKVVLMRVGSKVDLVLRRAGAEISVSLLSR